MPDLSPLYQLLAALLPLECMQARFMQQALAALLLLAPMTAGLGVQVVNLRMAFFSDAVSHSAFAGVALGLLLSADPAWTMPAMGLLVGLLIMRVSDRTTLSSDTVIGVFFSAVIAFGLAVVSRDRAAARDLQTFLYGDILTLGDGDVLALAGLFLALAVFQAAAFNRMLYVGLSPVLARTHGVRSGALRMVFAALVSLTVIFSVRAVGVFLVTALLVVPAAAARNLARSAGAMFWWALGVGLTSSVGGLVLSAQEEVRTATGATVVLLACLWFVASCLARTGRAGTKRSI